MNLGIRIHGRGGQGIKTAGRILSTAAFLEGRHAEDSPMYGPERRGAPVVSFVRISDEPVEGRGTILRPDAVVVADPTILDSKVFPVLGGLRDGSVVIVNGPPQKPIPGMPPGSIYFDVTKSSRRFLKNGNVSSLVAAMVCKTLGVAGLESLRRAVEMELGEIGLDPETVRSNLMGVDECFSLAPRAGLPPESAEDPEITLADLRPRANSLAAPSLIEGTGNGALNRTGDWRTSKPVIDSSRCTKCMVCYVYCPDSAIALERDLTPRIIYDNCKGCMICVEECPLKAIAEVQEVEVG